MVSYFNKPKNKSMQKDVKFYLGIDVSKSWFDLSLMVVIDHQKQPMKTIKFDNTNQGLEQLDLWLKEQQVTFNEDSLLVIENTGVYHRLIWEYCSASGLPIHIGNAARIKWSLGITRGKNDILDSQRLCKYACKEADEIKATPILDPVFIKIKDLMTSRTRLIKQVNSIKVYLGELKSSNSKEVQKIMMQAHKAAIDGIAKSITQVEAQIMKAIKENSAVQNNYDLLCSVPGIGPVTAAYIICYTNNFSSNISGKQLACYAGVAPFGSRSGSTIKKKDKVHPMANKDLKKLLHLCAMSVIARYEATFSYPDI